MSSDLLQQLAAATGYADDPGKQPLKEEPRVLLVTTVDVGGGASERIEVRAGEVPEDVARAFCVRHNLPEAIIGPLAQHLEENLRKAAANRIGGDSGKYPEGSMSQMSGDGTLGSFDQPQRTKSPTLPHSQGQPQQPASSGATVTATGGVAAPGSAGVASKPQYSFGAGMDERLYEQLSSKLLDESHAPSTRRGNWVSASEVLSGGGGGSGHNSKRSSSGLSNHHGGGGPYQYGKNVTTGPSPRDRDSVHLRLYATAQERAARLEERRRMANAEAMAALTQRRSAMSWISAEMMRGRGANGAFDNYGEMLYAEGVDALMSRLKRAESERKAREARELEGVTFAPVITKKAWELKQRERNSCSSLDGAGLGVDDYEKWQRLHVRGMRKSTQERLEQLRLQRETAELAECTFRPRINKNSDALMTERAETLKALNLTHHEQLYADAERRQAKMEELQRWYPDGVTFQPQVNKDPRAMEYLRRSWDRQKQLGPQDQQQQGQGQSGGSSSTPAGLPTGSSTQGAGGQVPPVVARLYAEAEKKQAKLEAARQLWNGNIDPVTQKPLFQPEIGRGPRGGVGHARGNRGGANIGEYLYRSAQELAKKRAAAEEAERRALEEEASRSRTTQASQRMFTELKLKRFRQIFEYLDEDGCGQLDLLAALGRSPPADCPDGERQRHPRVDNLDAEVLEDVEVAADVWARANGLMLTKEEQELASADGGSPHGTLGGSGDAGSPRPGSLSGFSSGCRGPLPCPCPPLSIEMFMSCMEEALRLQRCPRAYLVPSPPAKQVQQHSFRPAINARSRQLAAKSRPDTSSTFELLHRVAAKTAERLEALRRKQEEQGLAGCTFQPQLNTNRSSMNGRFTGRSTSSRPGSMDPSAFALAAAGIAAAANPDDAAALQAQAAEADRQSLQQHLHELRIAADAAMDIQSQLMAQVADDAAGEELEGVREDLEKFSALEKKLRDMQAVTALHIDDQERQMAAARQMQAQAAALKQQAHSHASQQQQLSSQHSQRGSGCDSVPSGGLQELAAVLGVSTASGSSRT